MNNWMESSVIDCYVLHKYERIWNTLMEFSDTDLKRFEDYGCES